MEKKDRVKRLTRKQRILRSMAFSFGGVKLHMIDDVRVEVEGCRGIVSYEEYEVRLSTDRLVIGIVGSDLQITRYDDELTVIEGIIAAVQYERG